MCECLDYDDGTRHTCEACVGDLEMLRDALARSEAARREAEERCDALYRIAYGRVDLIVRRDEYEKTDEIISLVGDPPPRATSILSLVEGLVTQRDAAKERAFVAEKALASERAAREKAEALVETWHVRAEAHRIAADAAEARAARYEAAIQRWREGRAHLGTPMTYVDQRLVDEARTIIGDALSARVRP